MVVEVVEMAVVAVAARHLDAAALDGRVQVEERRGRVEENPDSLGDSERRRGGGPPEVCEAGGGLGGEEETVVERAARAERLDDARGARVDARP